MARRPDRKARRDPPERDRSPRPVAGTVAGRRVDSAAVPSWARSPAFLAACLAVGTVLLFLPTLSDGFLDYDDPMYITDNPVVKQGLTFDGVRWAFTTTHFLNWLPVTWLSHMLDVSLYGLSPIGHHLTSVLLHGLNAALVFAVLRSFTGSQWRSLAAAAVFAVHPLRVESVAWLAERKDVLAATFFLLTLLVYRGYARRPSVPKYAGVLVLYALGLVSKTMLVTVPALFLLLDWWPLGRLRPGKWAARPEAADAPPAPERSWAWLVLEKLPLLALAAVASVWTVVLQGEGGATAVGDRLTFAQRAGNAAVSVWRYVGKTLLPIDLSPHYPHPGSWPALAVVGSMILLAAVTVGVLTVARRRPYLPVGWFWFLGMLAPVSGVAVQAGPQAMADRYTYLPGIGLALAAIWGTAELVRRSPRVRRTAAAVGVATLAVLAACTVVQQSAWRTDMDLFAQAVAVDPDNWFGRQMVGAGFRKQGRGDLAIEQFRRSLAIRPDNALLRLDLAYTLLEAGAADQAIAEFRTLAEMGPDWVSPPSQVTVRVGLARALAAVGQPDQADVEFAAAERVSRGTGCGPKDQALVQGRWALSLAIRGRRAEAAARSSDALTLDPACEPARAADAELARPATGPIGPVPAVP